MSFISSFYVKGIILLVQLSLQFIQTGTGRLRDRQTFRLQYTTPLIHTEVHTFRLGYTPPLIHTEVHTFRLEYTTPLIHTEVHTFRLEYTHPPLIHTALHIEVHTFTAE